MCNINLILRVIVTLTLSIVVLFVDNYYLFWLLLFYMLFISIVDRNYKSLLVNFAIVLILLFCLYTSKIRILLKVLFIVNILFVFFTSFSKKEKKYLYFKYLYKFNKGSRKKLFYKDKLDKVVKYNKDRVVSLYDKDVDLSNKVNSDIDNLYLYGKIRFYGYGNKIGNFAGRGFGIYDTLFLLVFLFLLVILWIYW